MISNESLDFFDEPQFGVEVDDFSVLYQLLIEHSPAVVRDPKILRLHNRVVQLNGKISQTPLDNELFVGEVTGVSLTASFDDPTKAAYSLHSHLMPAPTEQNAVAAGYFSKTNIEEIVSSLKDDHHLVSRPYGANNPDIPKELQSPGILYVHGFGGIGMHITLGFGSKAEDINQLKSALNHAQENGDPEYASILMKRIEQTFKHGNRSIQTELCDQNFEDIPLPDAQTFQKQIEWYAKVYKDTLAAIYIAKNYWPPSKKIVMQAPESLEADSINLDE